MLINDVLLQKMSSLIETPSGNSFLKPRDRLHAFLELTFDAIDDYTHRHSVATEISPKPEYPH